MENNGKKGVESGARGEKAWKAAKRLIKDPNCSLVIIIIIIIITIRLLKAGLATHQPIAKYESKNNMQQQIE